MVSRMGLCVLLFLFLGLAGPPRCLAQSKLGLQDAIDKALESRTSLKPTRSGSPRLEAEATSRVDPQSRVPIFERKSAARTNLHARRGHACLRDAAARHSREEEAAHRGSRKRRKSQPSGIRNGASRNYSTREARLLGSTRSSGDSRLVESFGEAFQEIVDYHSSR